VFRFQLTTTLCYGPDSLQALSFLAGKRVLIVTDAFMASTPLMQQVRDQLGSATVEVFDQVRPNPDVPTISAGLKAYLALDPDAIVALGGGSPIDTAKAVHKLALEKGHPLKDGLVVIPTTSGTGSEVTSFAVVTDDQHRKLPLNSPDMLPSLAILDPEAVRTAPPKLTADSGMDAVSHAIEAYVAIEHNDFSDALAEKALRMMFDSLPRAYTHGDDMAAREAQHTAATMAGIAFQNAGLGIVHGISHSIGGTFPVAHGRLNGMLLPHVMAFNAGEMGFRPGQMSPVAHRYAELARMMCLTATSERNYVLTLIREIEQLRDALDMPTRMTEAGIEPAQFVAAIPDLAIAASKDFCTSGNPVPVSVADATELLRKII
jgi:1-propanol dehydrogenase